MIVHMLEVSSFCRESEQTTQFLDKVQEIQANNSGEGFFSLQLIITLLDKKRSYDYLLFVNERNMVLKRFKVENSQLEGEKNKIYINLKQNETI